MIDNQVGNRPEVSLSDHDRCAECGRPVQRERWVSYRQDPDNPETLRQPLKALAGSIAEVRSPDLNLR